MGKGLMSLQTEKPTVSFRNEKDCGTRKLKMALAPLHFSETEKGGGNGTENGGGDCMK